MLQKTTGQRASELLNISQWASELTGVPGDIWTALQFDMAVMAFGIDTENKLNEGEYKDGKWVATYTLAELLEPPRSYRDIPLSERLKLLAHGSVVRHGTT